MVNKYKKIKYFIIPVVVGMMIFGNFSLDGLFAKKGHLVDKLFSENTAHAAYNGKHLRTVEYVLGGNASGSSASDNTSRASSATTIYYAGTTWNTATGTSGMKVVKIAGSGIVVKQAFLEVWWHSVTAANTTDIDLFLNLLNTGPNPGVNVQVNAASAPIIKSNGGLNNTVKTRGDATALFNTQTDAEFNAGVSVAAGVRVTGESRILTSAKLIVTYEQDYSPVAHTETKTVRFPLDSDGSGDTGSMQVACAGAATCDFSYYADMPDLASNSDITDVFVELHAQVNSATASTLTPVTRNNGVSGTSGPAYNWTDVLSGDNSIHLLWRPTVGGNDFNANTANQKIRITNGSVPLGILGGEIVVTYNFSTDAPNQTETISYFMKQQNATSGTTTSTDAAIPTYIANASTTVRNIWFKAHAAESETNTWILTGQVGSGTVRTQGYAVGGSNTIRAGKIATVFFDISQDVGNYTPSSTSATNLDLETVWSSATGDAPIAAEAFITFVWGGNQGGTVTKTIAYGNSARGAETIASETLEIPLTIYLPEQVTKTHRSTYMETNLLHSEATNLNPTATYTYTTYVNGNSLAITGTSEEGTTTTTEPYLLTYFQNVTATQFASSTGIIYWDTKNFNLAATHNQADEKYAAFKFTVTYDAALGENAAAGTTKHLRTVEYVLGGNASGAAASDNASRTSNTLAYAGTSWNTATGTSGMKVIKIAGSGIVVKQAFLEVWWHSQTAADTSDIDLFLNLLNTGPNPGVNVPLSGASVPIVSDNGGLNMTIKTRGDATALFGTQTDAQFNAGVSLAAAVRHTGETRRLTSAKLIVTYEQDYSPVAHTETKTVRFPLDSDGSGDTGSMQVACATSATCDFSYYADMPDLAQNSDITDVFVELHAQVNSATASTLTPVTRNNGASGTSGPGYNWTDTLAGDNSIHLLWRPTVGGNDFNANTANQKIRITNGTVPLGILGGEIVVTYNFSTDAPNQTETISYFMKQQTATSGTTTSTDAAIPTYIANASTTVRNIWFKAHAAESEANTWILTGQVGSGTVRTQGYAVGGSNTVRAGKIATVFFDISQDVGNYTPSSTSATNLDLETAWSSATGDAPIAAEAFITFVWGGNQGGTVTKTVSFGGTPGGAETVASELLELPLTIHLPEQVTKTHRSTYSEINMIHSEATNLSAIGTHTIYVNGNSVTVTPQGEEGTTTTADPYLFTYYQNVTATQFASSTGIIYWDTRNFNLAATHNQADEKYVSFKFTVTYDAALGGYVPTFSQSGYRLFANENSTSVGAPLAALNTSTTLSVASSTFRLRILLHVETGVVPVQYRSFKLQFVGKGTGSCSAPSGGSPASYTDVSASTAIAFNDNASPTDGLSLTATTTDPTHGGDTVVNQTYEEANNFTNTEAQMTVGQDGLWDFALKDYAATPGTNYCFRAVLSDNTVLTAYNQYPEIVTYTSGGGGNVVPTITSATDSPDPVAAGAAVYFNVDWNDTDSSYAQMFICKTNAFTTSTLTCDGGQWCNSVLTNRDPESCYYQTTLAEASVTPYNYYAFACDNQSACSVSSSGTFTVSEQEPTAPTELLTQDMPNAINVGTVNPYFSALFNDPNIGDSANKYCIQVNTLSNFTGTNLWYSDGGTCLTGSNMATTTQGTRSPDFTYAGSALNLNLATYYWRMWFWDQNGTRSATSSVTQFTMASGTDNLPQGVRIKGGYIQGGRLK